MGGFDAVCSSSGCSDLGVNQIQNYSKQIILVKIQLFDCEFLLGIFQLHRTAFSGGMKAFGTWARRLCRHVVC